MNKTITRKILCVITFVIMIVFASPFTVSASEIYEKDNFIANQVMTKNFETGIVTIEEYDYSYTRSINDETEVAPGVFVIPEHQIESSDSGRESEPSIQSDSNDGLSMDSVIGNDDRTQVTNTTANPYSYIERIVSTWDKNGDGINDETTTCTGFLEGPDVVITAGHCVHYNDFGGWLTSLTYYPAQNGSTYPFSSATMSEISISTNWANNESQNDDWAIVVVNRNVGAETGWMGLGWSTGSINGYDISVTGYPGDKAFGTMWTATGEITSTLTYRLKHDVDTYAGQSGAPMYTTADGVVWGIHAYGTSLLVFKNSGTRITEYLYNMIIAKCDEGVERYS